MTDADTDRTAIVAAGGATVGQGMRLHTDESCPCLGNAVETREATAGERRSREWCETCTGDTIQRPDFSAYNALVAAAEDGDAA